MAYGCDSGNPFERPRDVACPCVGCPGTLEFTGPNLVNPVQALVFLECPECGCAHTSPVSPSGLPFLRRERVEEAVDEHF